MNINYIKHNIIAAFASESRVAGLFTLCTIPYPGVQLPMKTFEAASDDEARATVSEWAKVNSYRPGEVCFRTATEAEATNLMK